MLRNGDCCCSAWEHRDHRSQCHTKAHRVGGPRNTCAGPVRQVLRRGQAHAVWGDLVHPASSSRRRMHNTPAVPAWPDVPGPCEADVAGPPGSRPHGSTGSPRGMRTARGGPAPFVCSTVPKREPSRPVVGFICTSGDETVTDLTLRMGSLSYPAHCDCVKQWPEMSRLECMWFSSQNQGQDFFFLVIIY